MPRVGDEQDRARCAEIALLGGSRRSTAWTSSSRVSASTTRRSPPGGDSRRRFERRPGSASGPRSASDGRVEPRREPRRAARCAPCHGRCAPTGWTRMLSSWPSTGRDPCHDVDVDMRGAARTRSCRTWVCEIPTSDADLSSAQTRADPRAAAAPRRSDEQVLARRAPRCLAVSHVGIAGESARSVLSARSSAVGTSRVPISGWAKNSEPPDGRIRAFAARSEPVVPWRPRSRSRCAPSLIGTWDVPRRAWPGGADGRGGTGAPGRAKWTPGVNRQSPDPPSRGLTGSSDGPSVRRSAGHAARIPDRARGQARCACRCRRGHRGEGRQHHSVSGATCGDKGRIAIATDDNAQTRAALADLQCTFEQKEITTTTLTT